MDSQTKVALVQRAFILFERVRSQLTAVGIPDMFFCDPAHHLIEYAPGTSIENIEGYDVKSIEDILTSIVTQVGALIECGLVHGDVKTENVVTSIDASGSVISSQTRLIDFGTMGEMSKSCSIFSDYITGTPYFMAPEQVNGQYERTTDVFSIGLMALNLLDKSIYGVDCWRIFRDRETLDHLLRDRLSGNWLLPDAREYLEKQLLSRTDIDTRATRSLIEFFFACTRQRHEDRPQSGTEMRQILTDTGNITEV